MLYRASQQANNVADLGKLRFRVERRQNTVTKGTTAEGSWELVAAFVDKASADNFAALKQLHATHQGIEYRIREERR